MSLTQRILPPKEWHRLAGTLLDPAWRAFDQASDRIIVVEDGDRIVGTASLSLHWHLEGAWIHPDYRQKVSVGRRLWTAARALVRALHVGEVFVMARGAIGEHVCRALGPSMKLTGDHFAVLIEDGRSALWQQTTTQRRQVASSGRAPMRAEPQRAEEVWQ